jgi:hypothetical protein
MLVQHIFSIAKNLKNLLTVTSFSSLSTSRHSGSVPLQRASKVDLFDKK